MVNPILKNNQTIKNNALANRVIRPAYEKSYRAYGMYVGVQNNPSIKQNKNLLLTMVNSDDFKDGHYYQSQEKYKRRTAMKNSDGIIVGYHEVGDYKMKWTLNKYPHYSNILHAWRDVFDYPQVSYGLTSYQREVVIIDSDVFFESFLAAKNTVIDFCKKTNIPMANYVLRNPTSGHIQLGWVLANHFEKKDFEDYNNINKRMAYVWQVVSGYEGDICFNGPSCKNPFYEGFESEIFSFEKVENVSFLQSLAKVSIDSFLSSGHYIYKKREEKGKDLYRYKEQRKSISKHSINKLDKTSRRDNLISQLDSWILTQMNKRHGELPTETETLEVALNLSKEIAANLNKKVLDTSEIKEAVATCLKYCKSKYRGNHNKDFSKNTSSFGDKARKNSRLAKRLNMFCKAVEIKSDEENLGRNKLAEKHNVSQGAVSKYKNMTKDEMTELAKEAEHFVKYCESFSELTIDYMEKKELACRTLDTFYKWTKENN